MLTSTFIIIPKVITIFLLNHKRTQVCHEQECEHEPEHKKASVNEDIPYGPLLPSLS